MLAKQQRLSDGRIVLDDIQLHDAPTLHKMLTDKHLCDKAGLMTHTHINQTIDFIYEGNHGAKHGFQYFYGIYVADELVGLINLFNVDVMSKSAEYGYFMSSEHTRNGYMIDSVKLLSNFVLEQTQVEAINIYIDVSNKPSLLLMKKLGLEPLDSNVEEDMQSRSVEMLRFQVTQALK